MNTRVRCFKKKFDSTIHVGRIFESDIWPIRPDAATLFFAPASDSRIRPTRLLNPQNDNLPYLAKATHLRLPENQFKPFQAALMKPTPICP
ncbi:hypothetical protein [Paralysiella testudinis]|uniref:Uncharacterized protein n=1 Tax=Paralysiella testudinis TaxID=2809020 RepID=A0A892ZGX4_9NEIS|nr:hypothetical protein [Paralysiella testudinis]QRQ80996.1 hypothetical protein JQU52_09655 [Paralysiella testudinis]